MTNAESNGTPRDMPNDETDFDEVIARERALLDPALRAAPEAVAALLDERFVEFGARGTIWDRQGTIAALSESPGIGDVETTDFHCTRISANSVLLTYRMVRGASIALRSSVWLRADAGWRLLFHQATPVQRDR